ncbi:MAG TPA: MmgE/PrpD family protein [Alphaproteobacteria bacterium]
MASNPEKLTGMTAAAARFVAGLRFGDLRAEAIRISRRCVLDGLAVMLAGSEQPGMAPLLASLKRTGGTPEAGLVRHAGTRLPSAAAALWNGTAGHAMDWDDTQLAAGPGRPYGLLMHPTVPPLAAALAVSDLVATERGRAVGGAEFLTAFNAGFELACKIAEAINPDHYMRGFHTSGTIGTFGACAAAAKLLGLDAAAIAQAIGIAASSASGIRANFGTMTKPLHVGRAAQNGVTAALLAREGFSGNAEALDGKWGYLAVAGPGGNAEPVREGLGRPFTIESPGVSIKPYPSGVLTHPSMDAMRKLMQEHRLSPADIHSVTLHAGSNVLGPIRFRIARTELEGKFSFAFLLSAVILRGRAGKAEFTDAFVSSPESQAMQQRIETRFDPGIEAMGWDKIRSRIEVTTADGRRLERWADERYRGGPDNPLSDAELEGKFRDCAGGLMDEERIQAVFELVWELDRLEDVGRLLPLLSWKDL